MAMGLLGQSALSMQKNRSAYLHVEGACALVLCCCFEKICCMSASLQQQVKLKHLYEIILVCNVGACSNAERHAVQVIPREVLS